MRTEAWCDNVEQSLWGQNPGSALGGPGPPCLDTALVTNRANASEGLSMVSGVTDKNSHY